MSRRIVGPIAFSLAAIVLLLLVAAVVILALREPAESWGHFVASVVLALATTAVGTLVIKKQPRNPAGWLLEAGGLTGALVVFDLAYAAADLPAAAYVEWLTSMVSVPVITGVFVLLLLTFPDGLLTAPRWRFVTRGWLVGVILFTLGNAFLPEALDGTGFDNPLAIFGTDDQPLVLDIAAGIGAALIAAAIVASVVSATRRFRRSRGVERQQMKWFVAAVPLVVLGQIFTVILYESGREQLANTITALVLITFPVSIGIAITRYRLYEIDRIINRTVVYAAVATLLAGLFTAGVALTSSVLPTGTSDLGVAGSTLVVAGLFNPLRRRVQATVNRRFYRTRYDPERVVGNLSTRLRDEVDPRRVGDEWIETVVRTLQPATAGAWFKEVGQ